MIMCDNVCFFTLSIKLQNDRTWSKWKRLEYTQRPLSDQKTPCRFRKYTDSISLMVHWTSQIIFILTSVFFYLKTKILKTAKNLILNRMVPLHIKPISNLEKVQRWEKNGHHDPIKDLPLKNTNLYFSLLEFLFISLVSNWI